jgi:hypothetical protein
MKGILVTLSTLVLAHGAAAQTDSIACPASPDTASPDTARAAIRVEASARIQSLRLNAPTSATASVRPCNVPGAVRVERENLPTPVQPGVTYRDVGVRVLITADPVLACRLSAALAADSARVRAAACEPPRP